MKKINYIFLSTLITIISNEAIASENNKKLSLNDCLKIALEKNLDIKSEKYNLNIQALSPQKIKDEFGVSFGLNPGIRNELRP
ncbi:MAG: hypothetical protein ACK4IX_07040, partial [Candidatus Sericytochromatia bacterium]